MPGGNFLEEREIAASQFIKEKEYWMNKFSGELVINSFPYDYQEKDSGENSFEKVTFNLTGEVLPGVEKLTRNSDPKLHIVLTTALVALFYKYTGSSDIIIGTPIDKQETDAELINKVLALRNQPHDTMTFKELILQVRQTIIQAIEHQNYPIETLLNHLNMKVSQKGFPLFDVALLLANIHDRSYLANVNPNMIFFFLRTGQGIEGIVEYNYQLYKQSTIERIIQHFLYLLGEMLANPDRRLSAISIVTAEEKKHLLFDFNDTGRDYPRDKTIHALFEEQVDRIPDQIALLGQNSKLKPQIPNKREDISITYKELNEKSNRLACLLREKNIQANSIVGIMMENSIEIIAGILGILKAGGAYLPIHPDYPEERINFMLVESGAKVLLAGPGTPVKFKAGVDQGFIEIIDIFDLLSSLNSTSPTRSSPPTLSRVSPANLAYVIYTSGTTGRPKGVMVKHRGLVNYIWWAARNYVRGERVNFAFYTSIAFDLTVTSIFTPLVTGQAMIVYRDEMEKKEFLIEKVIDDENVGVIKLTPAHLKWINKRKETPRHPPSPRKSSGRARLFIVGGEVLDTQLARDIHKKFAGAIEIYNEYGPTETVVGCMIYRFDPQKDKTKSVPIGGPIDNTKIYLLDNHQRPVPTGIAGELYIAGDGVARGYLNNPELTAEKFTNNPFVEGQRMYKTGDLAVRLSNGIIEFSGRADQQVKVRGFRIELGEIENQLLNHHEIKDAVVLLIAKPGKGDMAGASRQGPYPGNQDKIYLSAYIVPVKDKEFTPYGLKEYLSKKLPDYMIPSYFVRVEKIPLTPNGKINKKKLASLKPDLGIGREFVAPRNDIEKRIANIWMEVLDLDNVSIHENFFDLGGSSLDVVRLNTRFKEIFNSEEEYTSKIFMHTTISSFAQHINQVEDENRESVSDRIAERSAVIENIRKSRANQRNKRRGHQHGPGN